MSKTLVIHIFLALLWFFLTTERQVGTLLVGFVMGYLIIALFRDVIGASDYIRRVNAFVRFVFAFAYAFLGSCFTASWVIFFRKPQDIRSVVVEYDVSDLTQPEILLLSHCITLTPGTCMARISEDFNSLAIHALDGQEAELVQRDIDVKLRQPMLEFTR